MTDRTDPRPAEGPRQSVRPLQADRFSVVIPHLNQPEFLARCLASLAAGSRRPDEVIVVDNGSDALPQAICDAHGARLLTEAEPGPGPARNCGVRVSSGNILAFIDADCLADPGWLAAAEAAIADPSAPLPASAWPKIVTGDSGRRPRAIRSVLCHRCGPTTRRGEAWPSFASNGTVKRRMIM